MSQREKVVNSTNPRTDALKYVTKDGKHMLSPCPFWGEFAQLGERRG